jgi:hypothetical protein
MQWVSEDQGDSWGLRDAHLAAGLCGAVQVTRRMKQRMRSDPLLRRAGFPLSQVPTEHLYPDRLRDIPGELLQGDAKQSPQSLHRP